MDGKAILGFRNSYLCTNAHLCSVNLMEIPTCQKLINAEDI